MFYSTGKKESRPGDVSRVRVYIVSRCRNMLVCLLSVTLLDVFVVDVDIVIAVISCMFVVEADGVHQLVDDCADVDTAVGVQGDSLPSANGAHIGPAPAGGRASCQVLQQQHPCAMAVS